MTDITAPLAASAAFQYGLATATASIQPGFWKQLLVAWRLSFEDPAAGKSTAEAMIEEADHARDPRARAHAQLALASALLRYSDYPYAEQLLDELDAEFARLRDSHALVVASAVRATLLYIFGKSAQALELLRRTPSDVLDALAPMDQFVYFNALAFAALANPSVVDDSLIEESIRAYARALSCARSLAMPLLVVRMTANIAVHQMNVGAVDEAIRMAAEARHLAQARAESNLTLLCVLSTVTIMCRIELGEDHDLDADVKVLEALLEAPNEGWMVTNIVGPFLLAGCLLLIKRGELVRGEQWLARCEAELATCPAQDIQLRLAWARGEWHLAQDDARSAVEKMQSAFLGAIGNPPYMYQLSRRIAEAHSLIGQFDEAVAWFQRHLVAATRRARLASRVSFGFLQSREQLIQVERERDYARLKHEHAERTQLETEQFNVALRQKMEEIEDLQIQLHERSIRDALTGLYNRRHLNEVLPVQIDTALLDHEPMAIAMIDLDHFKQINDSWGHAIGDAVLAAMGRELSSAVRDREMAFRFGGEEFFCVFPGVDAQAAATRIEKLLLKFRSLKFVAGSATLADRTFSCGITTVEKADTIDILIARADAALYRAKQAGRARIERAPERRAHQR